MRTRLMGTSGCSSIGLQESCGGTAPTAVNIRQRNAAPSGGRASAGHTVQTLKAVGYLHCIRTQQIQASNAHDAVCNARYTGVNDLLLRALLPGAGH